MSTLNILLPVIAVVAAPLLAYIGVTRRLSGKVSTSDATELWSESRSIREEYRARIRELEQRITRLENDNELLRRSNQAFEREVLRLTEELEDLKANKRLLDRENTALLNRIGVLEQAVINANKSLNA